jgi:hypothetical protein
VRQNRARNVLRYIKVSCTWARQNPDKVIQIGGRFIEHGGMIFLPVSLKPGGAAVGKLIQAVGGENGAASYMMKLVLRVSPDTTSGQ